MLGNTMFFSAGRILKCQSATNKFKVQTEQVAVLLTAPPTAARKLWTLLRMSSNPLPCGRRDGGAGARCEQLPPRVRWSRPPRHPRRHLPRHPPHHPGQPPRGNNHGKTFLAFIVLRASPCCFNPVKLPDGGHIIILYKGVNVISQ